jgi:DNA-binding LytR/AlgR family response regulator
VARLRQRLEERAQGAQVSARLDALAEALAAPATSPRLEWIKAVSGTTVRLIAVDDVLAFKAVPGYTQVLTAAGEALIRTPLRDLLPRLDTRTFVQVHRNAIVNLRGVACARRLPDGRFSVELLHGRGCIETSRSRAALFREDGEA